MNTHTSPRRPRRPRAARNVAASQGAAALTPAELRRSATGTVPVERAYLYQLREAYGCHGSDTVGFLLSASPVTYDDLWRARGQVEADLAAAKRDAASAAAASAGAEPTFDDSFTGTRGMFEKSLAQWRARRDRAAATLTTLTADQAWAARGFELVDTCGVTAANSEYADPDDHELWALGHEIAHSCRCAHSGVTLLDPDDLDDLEPGESADIDGLNRCAPRPVAVVHAAGHRWLTTPDLLESATAEREAAERIVALADAWEERCAEQERKVADLEAQQASIPTDEQLLEMRPAEYRAALELRKRLSSVEWKLRDARSETPGRLLDTVCRRRRVMPVLPGFAGRTDTGWRRGPFKTVAEEVCGAADPDDGRG